jgi:hypothetical protein
MPASGEWLKGLLKAMATQDPLYVLPANSSPWTPWQDDEILTETYAEREAYAAEHGNSVQRIFEDLKRKEADLRLLLSQPPE